MPTYVERAHIGADDSQSGLNLLAKHLHVDVPLSFCIQLKFKLASFSDVVGLS